ncbi:MAG: serine hydrolase [Gemmatimonadota bacterium]
MAALRFVATLATVLLLQGPLAAQQSSSTTDVDAVFARFAAPHSPGCAVAVARGGEPILSRAYGQADLEHAIPNTAETIFEAGSVSKQFTAAAIHLLAQEGRLSLNDDVRQYVPELPEYDDSITLRHLLTHTSGLRDWGSVASIEGWPRGSRVHTHEHMLDIAARQKSLNYPPGEYYSYTNTGYNLQALIVERVSGMPFAEFSRTRIFEPLGLTSTQWRDDYTRVVPGRAQAYSPDSGGYRLNMPFENVHGNGGLLTTVGDLVRWTELLHNGEIAGPEFSAAMQAQARLNSGRLIEYASGLYITDYRDIPEISHSGATAGYRAFLTRYPDQELSVALLCNAANANATSLAHQVADLYLPGGGTDTGYVAANVSAAELASRVGLYRDTRRGLPLRIELDGGALDIDGTELIPLQPNVLQRGSSTIFEFETLPGSGGGTGFRSISSDGDTLQYVPATNFAPSAADLAAFGGTYRSDEAEATYVVTVQDGRLLLQRPFDRDLTLTPAYEDAFTSGSTLIRFHRDQSGRVRELSYGISRVWDMRFGRVD